MAIDPATPSTVYVGMNGGGMAKSTNGGASWTVLNSFPSFDAFTIAIDPAAPSTLFAGGMGAGGTGVFESMDGGASWTAVNAGLPYYAWVNALAIDPATPSLYAGTLGGGVFVLTVTVCGDGIVDGSEQCDDGPANGQPGDCCTATCQFRPAGTGCANAGDLCTLDVCNATGTCTHSIAPSPTCTMPTVAKGAALLMQALSNGRNRAHFKWGEGPAVPLADFGNPCGGGLNRFCVYEQTGPNTYALAVRGSPSVSGGGI